MERILASEGIEPGARKQIIKYQKELETLRKTVSTLESEMIQFGKAQTYFKPTNKGNKLRNELQTKIDNSVESIAIKKRKISEVVQKINELSLFLNKYPFNLVDYIFVLIASGSLHYYKCGTIRRVIKVKSTYI